MAGAALVLAACAAHGPVSAQGAAEPQGRRSGPNYRIVIDAPAELVDSLRSRTLLGRWQNDPDFEHDQMPLFVARAQEEAVAIARDAGFFSASATVEQVDTGDGVPELRITVDAGARTTVSRLQFDFEGAAAGGPGETLARTSWPLGEGSFFRVGEWEQGKRQLIEQLQQRGYVRARIVSSRAEVNPETTAASLQIAVDSGPRMAFGEIDITGLERYPRSIVDSQRTWDDGDRYSLERLTLFQQRLRADDFFSSVSVLPDLAAVEADPELRTVPILVEVRERSIQRVTTGVGYSNQEGARVLLGYRHNNLFGSAWTFDSGALVEQRVRRRIFADIRSPYDRHGHRWQTGVRSERFDVSGQLTDKSSIYFGRGGRSEDIEYFVSLQYQSEQSRIDTGTEVIADRNRALTLGYAWTMRRLDSQIDPRRGYSISAQVSGAHERLGSDASFVRVYGRGMRFWPMPADSALAGGVLIGLVEAGMVAADSRDGIPSENLFRAGGAQSVRGFRYMSLGVRQGDAIVGGRVLALGSLEYQHPIVASWYGAVFADVGNAADRWQEWEPVGSAGVGVRWRSPIGPINLDAAWAGRDRGWRLHFSVGYTF